MNQDMKAKVSEYFAKNRDNIVNDLADLCRINSEKSAAKPGAPFGDGPAAAVQAAADKAKAMGFDATVFPEGGYALAYSGTGDKTIGFFGHCDVVPAGTGWTMTGPYEPVEKDGILFARGSADNKNGVVAGLWVMKAIKDLGLPVNARLMTFMGGDEESGMEDVKSFAETQPMPDLCLIPDTSFPVCNGEKGILEGVFRCKTPFNEIISLDGGYAANVIIGEAEAKVRHSDALLAQLKALAAGNEAYAVASDGAVITIKAKGRSGHAAMPDGSLNAARLLADLLVQCDIDPSDKKIMGDVSTALSDDYAVAMGFAAEDKESGKMTVACGIAKTEESRLSLGFNPRYCVTIEGEQVIRGFKNYFEPRGWEPTLLNDSRGYYIPTDDARVQTLMNIYKDLTGDTAAEPYVMGGGTYARKLKNAMAFGPAFSEDPLPYDLPAGHGSVHQPDEGVVISELIKGIELYTIAIVEVDKVL